MITKEQREKDKAICEAATKGRWQYTPAAGVHVRDREGWTSIAFPEGVELADVNGEAIANAVNRLPEYIADAEEMDRRIGALLEVARRHEAHEIRIDSDGVLPPEVSNALDDTAVAVLRLAVRILRGEL